MALWKLQNLQVVWWCRPVSLVIEDVYTALTGLQPSNVQTASAGPSVAVGGDSSCAYRVQFHNARLDYIVTPPQTSTPISFPLIANPMPVIQRVKNQVGNASPLIGDAQRLAVVFNLSEAAQSPSDATTSLASHLNIPLAFSDGSDFIFQVNRKLSIPPQVVEYNRVLKWHHENFQHIDVSAGGATIRQTDLQTYVVDVNTAAGPSVVISQAAQAGIFAQMFAEAERLANANTYTALS